MSELSFKGQESNEVPYLHDCPPQYDPCETSQDVLTLVIENEQKRRALCQKSEVMSTECLKLTDRMDTKSEIFHTPDSVLKLARFFKEMAEMTTELADIYKERTANKELYTAMSKLTDSELNQTHASLKREPNQRMRHELSQDNKNRDDCPGKDPVCGSPPRSSGQFIGLSASADNINDQPGQLFQSDDSANASMTIHDAPATPHRSFWKRIWKHSARF